MRNYILCSLVIASSLNIAIHAIPLEWNAGAAWGKRFEDKFDREMTGMTGDSANLGSSGTTTGYNPLRDLLEVQTEFLFSPSFRHYLGVGFGIAAGSASVATDFSGVNQRFNLIYFAYSPFISYRYDLIPESVFLSVAGGYYFSDLEITGRESGTNTSYTFDRAGGFRLRLMIGTMLPISEHRGLILGLSFEGSRIDGFDGSSGSDGAARLKSSTGQVYVQSGSDQSRGSEASLWMNNLALHAAFALRFGQ